MQPIQQKMVLVAVLALILTAGLSVSGGRTPAEDTTGDSTPSRVLPVEPGGPTAPPPWPPHSMSALCPDMNETKVCPDGSVVRLGFNANEDPKCFYLKCPVEPSPPSPPPLPDPRLVALNVFYGGSVSGGELTWHPTDSDSDFKQGTLNYFSSTSPLVTTVFASASSTASGGMKEYILTETRDPECHANPCFAVLGGAILVKQDDRWSVSGIQKFIALGGQAGRLRSASPIVIGKDRIAFQYVDGTSGQGGIDRHFTIYAPVDDMFKNILDIPGAYVSTAVCDHDKPVTIRSTTLEPLPSAKDFYDIKSVGVNARYTGRDWKAQTAVRETSTSTVLYIFDGNKYVKASEETTPAVSVTVPLPDFMACRG